MIAGGSAGTSVPDESRAAASLIGFAATIIIIVMLTGAAGIAAVDPLAAAGEKIVTLAETALVVLLVDTAIFVRIPPSATRAATRVVVHAGIEEIIVVLVSAAVVAGWRRCVGYAGIAAGIIVCTIWAVGGAVSHAVAESGIEIVAGRAGRILRFRKNRQLELLKIYIVLGVGNLERKAHVTGLGKLSLNGEVRAFAMWNDREAFGQFRVEYDAFALKAVVGFIGEFFLEAFFGHDGGEARRRSETRITKLGIIGGANAYFLGRYSQIALIAGS